LDYFLLADQPEAKVTDGSEPHLMFPKSMAELSDH